MKSRDDTSSRQPHVNEKDRKKGPGRKPTDLRVELTWGEPSPEGDAAWENLIDLLIKRQLEHIRANHGEATVMALLQGVEDGLVDPRLLLGILPPTEDGD